ncbi:MAG: alkaline shock response membrane anchor protein AmaP [Bacillota bacterium]|nr:alkaline shock response membrane anchor protein AmaP [Bacillota bacterium]
MKIRITDRILLLLFVLAAMALAVVIPCIIFGAIPQSNFNNFMQTAYADGWMKALITAICAVVFLIGFRLLIAGLSRPRPKTALLASSAEGSIRISLVVLDELAQKFANTIQEIKEIKTDVFLLRDGVKFRVKYTIVQEASVPEISTKLQTGIKQFVEMYTGITVKSVEVMVEKTSSTPKKYITD